MFPGRPAASAGSPRPMIISSGCASAALASRGGDRFAGYVAREMRVQLLMDHRESLRNEHHVLVAKSANQRVVGDCQVNRIPFLRMLVTLDDGPTRSSGDHLVAKIAGDLHQKFHTVLD